MEPVRHADRSCEEALARFPRGLRIYCIDDSETACRLLHHHLTRSAQTTAVRTYGRTAAEVATFVRAALADADIAILDQHLEYGADANVLGTDIIRELKAKGFRGLCCVRSGNVAPEDLQLCADAGADCAFGKEMPMRQMVQELKAAYVAHTGGADADTDTADPCPDIPGLVLES